MSADDTSREALVERMARAIHAEKCCPCDPQGCSDDGIAAEWAAATAAFDAVVSPLIEERDRLRTELAEAQRVDVERFASLVTVTNNCMGALAERDRLAAEKAMWQSEAWERGYMFAFAQERGDHTHSRPVPDYLADDIRSWNPYLTPEQP